MELVADFVAVRHTDRGADVARGEYLFVADNDAAATATVAGGAGGDYLADFHEIFIPRGTNISFLIHKVDLLLV